MESLLRILVVLLAVAEDQESSHALQEHPNSIHDYYVQTPQKPTLHSCDDLCRLCSADTPGCARSMTELSKHCVMSSPFEGTDASCTGRRRHICTRHLSVVEHFLRSQNGFWCRITDKNSIIYHTQDLNDENSGHFLTACTDFLRTRNFWLGQNRAHCPAKPTQKIGVHQAVTTSSGLVRQSHRTTRSPANYYANASGNNNNNGYNAAVNNRIQRWKTELSSDLAEFSRVLPAVSCNSALHDLCLQHISCRELWKIFRQSCVVDAQNQCQMTNPNDCWQSFEGISWTGLGTCSCFDNNSDCHWIRLQTNYNKCIYELSLTMGSSSTLPLQDTQSVPSTTMTTPTPASSGEVLSTSPSTPKVEQNFGQKPLYYQNGRANVQRNDRERDNERRLQQEKDALELKRISEEKRRVQLQQQEQQRLYQQRLDEYRIKHEAARQQQEEQRRREMEDRRREHEDHQQALQQAQPEPTPWYERPLQPVHSRHTSREEWRRPQQYPQARSQTQRSNPSATSSSGSVIDYNVSSGRNQKYENKTGANANQVDIYTLGKQPTEASNVEDGGGVYVLRIHATKTSRNGEESGTVSTPDTKQIWTTPAPTPFIPPPKKVATTQATTTTTTSTSTTTTTPSSATTVHPTESQKKVKGKVLKTTMATTSIIPDEDDNKNATVVLISRTNPYKVEAKEEQIGEGESTCQAAYKQCEQSETCRWHLSELQIKCPLDSRHCRREQCTKAIGRFTRYVSKAIVESMMFCQCSFGDGQCKHLQQWMYPQCIYSYPNQKPKWTCTQAMKLCQSDGLCLRNLPSFNSSCAIHTMSLEPPEEKSAENIACASATLPQCRMAIISVRGTFLETPCYCDANDAECMDKQNLMLPTNPCIELAMLDYHSNPGSSISALSTSSTYLKPKPPVVSTKSKIRTHHKPKSDTTDSENPTEVTLVPSGDESMDKSKKPVEKPSSTFSKYEEHIAKYKAPSDRLNRTTTTTVAPLKEEIEEEKSVQSAPVEPTSSAFQTSTDMAFEALNDTSIEEFENTTRSTLATLDPEVQAAALKKLNARKQFRVKPGNFLPTGEYVTMRPPPKEGGCSTRNIDGEWIVHYKDSIFRQYHDWSGTCSSWCECTSKEALECHDLGCLTDVQCEALHTTVRMGERLYLEGRGACLCLSGKFVCETSEEQINLSPGLYITLGYSKEELSLLREKVKKNQLEKSGLVSPTVSVANDIASRLQFALERILPENTMCRIALLDHFPMESVVLLQVQWYGVNVLINDTQPKWHIGRLEKQCSPFVRELEHTFLLERADRYQLVLSTVKQIKLLDLLDGLPPALLHSSPSAAVSWRRPQNHVINLVSLYLSQLFGFWMFLFPMFRCF